MRQHKEEEKALKILKPLKVRIGERKRTVPDGVYSARVVAIDRRHVMKNKEIFEFKFEIAEGLFRGIKLSGFVPAGYEKFTEYTKLYQWYLAATGDAPEEGEEVDLTTFYDRVLKVRCSTKVAKRTGNEFSNVVAIEGSLLEDVAPEVTADQ